MDSTFHPIYKGARVKVVPGFNEKLQIEIPSYKGEVLSIDEHGVLRVLEEGSGGTRLCWPRKCLVIRPKRNPT